jgi:uncharacterized protein YjiS (DUF1127 family)
LSTVKGSPQDDVWALASDRREKLKRVATRILNDLALERNDLDGKLDGEGCRR